MSKNEEKALEKVQDAHLENSVYDFLYCDSRRIGSFLSQFDPNGELQKLVAKESASKIRKRGYKWSLGGGATVIGTGGSGSLGFERSPGDQASEELQREYDPLWTNALTLLDFLEDEELLNKNITETRIGQFAMHRGNLSLFDLATFKSMWNNPDIKKMILTSMGAESNSVNNEQTQNRSDRRRSAKTINHKSNHKANEAEIGPRVGFELIPNFPHAIHASIFDDDNLAAWCSLREEWMISPASEILIKHGCCVAGQWTIVGILDALPEMGAYARSDGGMEPIMQMISASRLGSLGEMIGAIAPAVRTMLGRPADSFGITPLMIFREVSG